MKIFKSEEIEDWTDRRKTAICPYCGIDSVLRDTSGYEISKEVLEKLHISF